MIVDYADIGIAVGIFDADFRTLRDRYDDE